MTRFRLLFVALALAPLAGCETFKGWMDRDRPREHGTLPPVEAQKLVDFVNVRAAQTQTLTADVRITASKGGVPIPATLTGPLTASQPRNFRLRASGKLAGDVDLGSNPEQFWVYMGGTG